MEIRQLRYFLAVAEDLHFTCAAERLHVAQPALSLQIRQLEEEIGAKLLERTNRRVALTAAGEAFRARAALVVEQANRALVEASQIGRGEAGVVSIGFVSSAVCGVLPEILRRFRESVPAAGVELDELEPSEQLERIRQYRLDIGLMHAVLHEREFDSVTIARDRLVAAIPEKHPCARRRRIALRDLAGDAFFIPKQHAHSGFHELVLAACDGAGFTPARIQPTRLLQTAVALVAGGLGVTLVPESFESNLSVKGVVYRHLAGVSPVAQLIAVWSRENRSPLVARLVAELRRRFER
ncbi:MAG: LysR family transcriptional regulator [Acidobacteriota bacterium]|nr:LysR family transcriptional regulator [Acidobacteriota bacterium]